MRPEVETKKCPLKAPLHIQPDYLLFCRSVDAVAAQQLLPPHSVLAHSCSGSH